VSPVDHLVELRQVFRVTADDLASNRAGSLGPGQIAQLHKSGTNNLLAAVAGSVALVAGVFAVAERPFKPVQVILAGVLVAALLAVGVVMLLRSRAAAEAGDVICLIGPVRVRVERRAGTFLYVDDRRLRLTVPMRHIQNGAPYRVYIAHKASRIVAMEPDGWA